jgi:hypothetical protein
MYLNTFLGKKYKNSQIICNYLLFSQKLTKVNSHAIGLKLGQSAHPGTDVMILNIFLPKILAKILAFLL